MNTSANTPLPGTEDMATSDRFSSQDVVCLPTSPNMEASSTFSQTLSTPEYPISMTSVPNPTGAASGASMCTPHPGLTCQVPVVEAVAYHRRAMRKTRQFGGRQSESPYARRKLVFEIEREE